MSTISLYPQVSFIVILILSMISILISLTGLIYRTKGSVFRTLTLIIIIFSLMNPKIIAENKIDIPDIVALIIDLSPSQKINDRHLLAQKASKLIEEKLNKNKNIEVRSKTIDEKYSTKIFGELSKLTGDIPRNRIAGAIIITDGQIRRASQKNKDLLSLKVKEIMTLNPISINQDVLAAKALSLMNVKKITSLCVHSKKSKNKTIGIIHIHNILESNIQ